MKLFLCSNFKYLAPKFLPKFFDLSKKHNCLFIPYADEDKDFVSESTVEFLQILGFNVFHLNEEYKFENDDTIIRIPGIPVGIYDYRLTGIYPVKAINTIRKWNLDVIHSHTEFGVGTFARIVSKQFNIPLIHTYHTMYEDYIHYITKGYFDKSSKKFEF